MTNILTYVALTDAKTLNSFQRTCDLTVLNKWLPSPELQNKLFLVGSEMEIFNEKKDSFVKYKVESMEYRVMDGNVKVSDLSGDLNPHNTELRIYLTEL